MTEKKVAVNRRIAEKRIGTLNPPGPSEAGVNNWKAKFWGVMTPERNIIFGVNLAEIIRRNLHRFSVEDVNPSGRKCRAYKGLNQLYHLQGKEKRVVTHWKGWRAVTDADMVKAVESIPPGRELMLPPQKASREA